MLKSRTKLVSNLFIGALAALLCIVVIAPSAGAMPITFKTGDKVATFDTSRCHLMALEGFQKALLERPLQLGVSVTDARQVSAEIDQAVGRGDYIPPPAPAKLYGLSHSVLQAMNAEMSKIHFHYS